MQPENACRRVRGASPRGGAPHRRWSSFAAVGMPCPADAVSRMVLPGLPQAGNNLLEASPRETVTRLLQDSGRDDEVSLDPLIAVLYDELHALAHRTLSHESAEVTLSTTVLLHEAYLKLVGSEQVTSRGRNYFFGAATRAMRQVLVDHARRRTRKKRGGGVSPLRLEEVQVASDGSLAEVLEVDEALKRLADASPRAARVVESRFFGGLTLAETAGVLGVSHRTAKRDWAFARAWLFREMGGGRE